MGQFGNKLQIAIGSYIGTGTYGSKNPNSLTFEFEPKLVAVSCAHIIGESFNQFIVFVNAGNGLFRAFGIIDNPGTYDNNLQYFYTYRATFGNSTLSWYQGKSAEVQLNLNNFNYNYFAIG